MPVSVVLVKLKEAEKAQAWIPKHAVAVVEPIILPLASLASITTLPSITFAFPFTFTGDVNVYPALGYSRLIPASDISTSSEPVEGCCAIEVPGLGVGLGDCLWLEGVGVGRAEPEEGEAKFGVGVAKVVTIGFLSVWFTTLL